MTVVLAVLVTTTVVAGALFYRHLNSNITVDHTADRILSHSKPNAQGQSAMNILVLGSQTRNGQSGPHLGNASKLGTNISDTAMLVHLNADRSHAVVVSIPRDLVVPRPACRSASNPSVMLPASRDLRDDDMFDLAMNLGGPACAVATVEQMSGLPIDHFIVLTFNGFEKMVNTVGGVTVCVPPPGINDWRSGLVMSAGLHVVTGYTALAFVRDRHGVGDGGDRGRIQMQQMFVSSLIQKVESAGTLANPDTLLRLADAATSALSVDPGLGSVSKLLGLASQLSHFTSRGITFVTAPNTLDPSDTNRLIPLNPQFEEVWRLLRADQPWTGKLPSSSTPAHVVGASAVKVRVLNGSGVTGKAAAVAAQLRALGFDVTGIGTTTVRAATTVSGAGAATVLTVLGGAPRSSPGGPQVTLVIGTVFGGVHAPPATATTVADTASAAGVQTRSAAANICSNLPKPRSDAAKP
jgi:LCP family protein required for cell wall assembly